MSPLKIAVAGSGISGLSAAWLLSQRHDVTLFEQDTRIGGHSNTVTCDAAGRDVPVDTGFIVYNEPAYPNLTALFDYLDVPTAPSNMTFSVSLGQGAYEYAGSTLLQLIGQPGNAFSIGHWRLIRDLLRFLRTASADLPSVPEDMTLGGFVQRHGYSRDFVERHLLPMAGAIWSSAPQQMLDYPARAFIRFFDNHGLLKISNRPAWRTVRGGSREYVNRLVEDGSFTIRSGAGVARISRRPDGVCLHTRDGAVENFDHVVIAAHADQALAMLDQPSAEEARVLGAFTYSRNRTYLHTDASLMPKRRGLWSSWNYLAPLDAGGHAASTVTYWMNSLQPLATEQDMFISLNPPHAPRDGSVRAEFIYEHPVFNPQAMAMQRELWSLQGQQRTWFCGAYFGSGFHEDGLQAGLAVAEQLGDMRRPWNAANESGRIHLGSTGRETPQVLEAAE